MVPHPKLVPTTLVSWIPTSNGICGHELMDVPPAEFNGESRQGWSMMLRECLDHMQVGDFFQLRKLLTDVLLSLTTTHSGDIFYWTQNNLAKIHLDALVHKLLGSTTNPCGLAGASGLAFPARRLVDPHTDARCWNWTCAFGISSLRGTWPAPITQPHVFLRTASRLVGILPSLGIQVLLPTSGRFPPLPEGSHVERDRGIVGRAQSRTLPEVDHPNPIVPID